MRNSLVIAIYFPFFLATAVACAIELSRKYKRRQDWLFSSLCLCAFAWYAVTFAGLLTGSEAAARLCVNLVIVCVGFIPPLLLLFVIRFYSAPVRLPRWAAVLLFVIPCGNAVMAFTAGHHSLMNEQLVILSLGPQREILLVWGIWFWIHTAYSYLLSVVIITFILTEHFHLKRFYRLPSTILIAGVFLTLVGNIVTLLQILPASLDPTLLTMSLSIICFSAAIINSSSSKFVRFSRAQLYNYMEELILVLDDRDTVIDANSGAAARFASLGIPLKQTSFGAVTEALKAVSWFCHNDAAQLDNDVDIHLRTGGFPLILNQRICDMRDVTGELLGRLVVYSDVTENRTLIEQLENRAHMDSLTGLPNHMAYEGALARLGSSEHLPLGVIVCDINNLKAVNDGMGHKYGDMLIRAAGRVLETACPQGGFAARIGGDEFILLLPQSAAAETAGVIADIRRLTAELTEMPFAVSIALGAAVRTDAGEDTEAVTARADADMYEDKKRLKADPGEKFLINNE